MQIGMTLPTMVAGLDRSTVLGWCRGVDEGPWSTLSVGERIGYPNQDMLATLAAAAAITSRVRLATSVVILPMHPAVEIAKWAATVDVLSEGRLTLGVGIGGRDEDYVAMQAPLERRHQRLDDQVATMQRVWAGGSPGDSVTPVGPPPVQSDGPPLWAGAFGPKAMARAARWAQGILGFLLDPAADAAREPIDLARRSWADADREDTPWMATTFWYGLGAEGPGRVRDYARSYLGIFGARTADALAAQVTAGSADAVLAALDHLEATGYDEVLLVPTTGDLAELDATVELVARR